MAARALLRPLPLKLIANPSSRSFHSPPSTPRPQTAMKSVCIVGAGPGGLVAAKTLIEAGDFAVTVYERNERLGGLWMFDEGARGNKYLSSSTPTNLSRYTVSFSDLSWESVPLRDGRLSMFPSARQVGEYLQEYASRFIPAGTVSYNHRVTDMNLLDTDGRQRWEVTTASPIGEKKSTFDHVINAAGFFSDPVPFHMAMPSEAKTTALHSSAFKSLEDLFPDRSVDVRNTNVLLLGGGNSGGEAAASVAFQLSSALNSLDPSNRKRFEGITVRHLIKRPFYAIPPYIPSSNKPTYAPLDFQFYDLQWRPKDTPIESTSGLLQADAIPARHKIIQGMVGNQRDLQAPALGVEDIDMAAATYAALSETYPEFVRSGAIMPYRAKLMELRPEGGGGWVSAEALGQDGSTISIPNVSAVLDATGYTANPSISFLSADVQKKLEVDPESVRLPVLLQNWQTLNPSVPTLGFIGYYVGPYWGVMEMQARVLAKTWSETPSHTADAQLPRNSDESIEKLREMRNAMGAGAPAAPQYWFSDYTAYLEELSRHLGLNRNDAPFADDREGPVSAARYLSPRITEKGRHEAQTTMQSFHAAVMASKEGRFRARAVFRGLQGRWILERFIKSDRSEMPSGNFRGEAWLHPRAPTDPEFDGEHLYIESGTFQSDAGFEMTASRRYVYRYSEARDELSVWFVKPDDGLTVDYLFHRVDLAPVPSDSEVAADAAPHISAKADHLCEQDMYSTSFDISMAAVSVKEFEVQHEVHGPAKDYVATAKYKRRE